MLTATKGQVAALSMLVLTASTMAKVQPVAAAFVTFESGQVRPLAMAPGGNRLFAVNTPDNQLEIFDVDGSGLTHVGAVPVGLEPVAVAARTDTEVWVVNHLSDSVSIVDVGSTPPRVVRTLLVGDEPRDIVFGGTGRSRAFITSARRGQNLPPNRQADLTTAGIGRALVWVFDATSPGDLTGGTPLNVIALFGDSPRALAVSPNGLDVYAAVFHSGNQTTVVSEGAVCDDGNLFDDTVQGPCGGGMPGGLPLPERNVEGTPRPEAGLIVKYNQAADEWQDELGRNWNPGVRFDLPDRDVFSITASVSTPMPTTSTWSHVGTVLYNMIVNPADTSKRYVTNTEAVNEVRFEGPGILATTVRGHLHEARITVIDGSTVLPRHLNKHLNYTVVPSPPGDKDKSLATPTDMAINAAGTTLYVAAFGSSKVAIFDTGELLADTFVPDAADHVVVSGGGPSGLALDEARDRLYVLTRFDNSISVIDTGSRAEITHLPLHNPEPAHVVDGRPFLYDAVFTSSNGEASCSSCHVFGDLDSLAWDLGNPDDIVINNPNPFRVNDPIGMSFPDHHPMKGPMTTQSLRGMANHGPMHWRGDRTGGNDPGGNALDETQAFLKFNPAFDGLIGRGSEIPPADMAAFAAFILDVTYPPNPVRALDNSLTADEQAGRDRYFGANSDVFQNCNGCHRLNPAAGFFGSDGFSSFEFEKQLFKIPHLRNLYSKVGMFGMAPSSFFNPGDNGHKGDQIRGFGFMHDGSADTIFRFHDTTVFNQTLPGGFPLPNPGGFPNNAAGDVARRQMEAFMLAFDSNLAPIVGQQATLSGAGGVEQRILASKIMIKDPNLEERIKIVVVGKSPLMTVPAAASADDPRCGSDPSGTVKAHLTIASAAAGQQYTAPLVCDNWTAVGPSSAPKGYRYKDPELDDSAVKTLTWKAGSVLKAVLKGDGPSSLGYSMVADQGQVEVQLVSGAHQICLACGGEANLDTGKFLGKGIECSVPTQCLTPTVNARIDLFVARAEAAPQECDLVVKGTVAGEARGWHYRPASNDFESDRDAEPGLTDAQLRGLAAVSGQYLTYTCVPPGSGQRIGIDRDDDGFYDRDEIDDGSDPADPLSTP